MKATELRIGNYINGMTGKMYETITSIDQGRVSTDNENSYNINHVEPIPLTEEWLLRLGFKLCDICKDFGGLEMPYYANNAVLLFFNSNRTKYELSDYYIGYGSMRSGKYHVVAFKWIKYVHQLQNLYFALTGEELEMTEQ